MDRLLRLLHLISEGLHARDVLQRAVSTYCHVTGVGLLRAALGFLMTRCVGVLNEREPECRRLESLYQEVKGCVYSVGPTPRIHSRSSDGGLSKMGYKGIVRQYSEHASSLN